MHTPLKTSHAFALLGASLVVAALLITQASKSIVTSPVISQSFSPRAQTAAISGAGSGLVAHYTFDGNTNDSAGSNNGTANGGPTYTVGKIGQAIQLDGMDDYVSASSIGTQPAYSVSFWAKKTGAGTHEPRGIMFSQYDTYIDQCFNGQVLFSINTSAGGQEFFGGGTCASTGAWTHYTGTYDGTVARLYINGTQVSAQNKTGTVSGAPLSVGSYNQGSGYFFNGSVDDLRVYDRALTPSEVTELYTYTGSGGGTPSPVNGSCSTTMNTCSAGIFSDVTDTSSNYLWSCQGSNGGTTASCTLAIPTTPTNGQCGPAAKSYTGVESFPGGAYCSVGSPSPSTPTNPSAGGSISWTCSGANGGSTPTCTATRASVITPIGTGGHFYIAQTTAGDSSASSCSNAQSISWLNTSSNWGTGSSQVGPGDTVHLCGTISTPLTIQGSGTNGNPITVLFENGANLTRDVWPTSGAIQLNGVSWIVIDGGANGVIQNTDNGPALTYQQNSRGIGGHISGVGELYHGEIKNLTIKGIYKKTIGMNDWSRNGYGIDVAGSNITIKNNRVSDGDGLIGVSCMNNATCSSFHILDNIIRDYNHGITVGSGDINSYMTDLVIARNSLDYSITWDTIGDSPIHLDAIIIFNNVYDLTSRIDNVKIYGNWFGPHIGTRTTAGIFNGMSDPSRQAKNWYIFNNVFEAAQGSSWGNGFIACTAENLKIFNNSFIGTIQNGNWGGGVQFGGSPAIFQNNILWSGQGVTMQQFTNDIVGQSSTGGATESILNTYFGNIWSDYNIFVGASPGFGLMLWKHQPADVQWRSGILDGLTTGWQTWFNNNRGMSVPIWNTAHADPHSKSVPPVFVQGTYIPATTDTVARGAGLNLSSIFSEMGMLAVDYNGNPRPATGPWTIGAFEVTGTTQPPPPTFSVADFNRDGLVNSLDLSLLVIAWNTNNSTYDLNSDGIVNSLDYVVMVRNWTP